MARPPAAVISATTASAGVSPVLSPCSPAPGSLTTTAAPWAASARQCARPRPRPPPVTIATLSSSKLIAAPFVSALLSLLCCRCSGGPQDQSLRVEEKTARGDQGDPRARHLAAARLPAQLGHRLAQVAGSLRAALGQAAAVGVHRHPPLDLDPVLHRVPVVGQERPGLSGTAEAVALEAAQGHEAEAVVGKEQVDVVEPQIALGSQVAG